MLQWFYWLCWVITSNNLNNWLHCTTPSSDLRGSVFTVFLRRHRFISACINSAYWNHLRECCCRRCHYRFHMRFVCVWMAAIKPPSNDEIRTYIWIAPSWSVESFKTKSKLSKAWKQTICFGTNTLEVAGWNRVFVSRSNLKAFLFLNIKKLTLTIEFLSSFFSQNLRVIQRQM